jgi:hypothetical protein
MRFPRHSFLASVLAICVGILTAATADQANADFLEGQQMSLEIAWPTQTNINDTFGPFTVGPGPEVTISNMPPLIDCVVDVSDGSLTIEYPNSASALSATFNGCILTEESVTIPPFQMAIVDPSTTVAGFSQSRVSFDATHVYINNSGLIFQPGQIIKVNFTAIPEPSTFALLGVGAFGLLTYAWRWLAS